MYKANIYSFKFGKITWGLKHKALKTIYTGGILPLILYEAPVWKRVMENKCYKAKLIGTQRIINIRIPRPTAQCQMKLCM